jgi:hypothetical protein
MVSIFEAGILHKQIEEEGVVKRPQESRKHAFIRLGVVWSVVLLSSCSQKLEDKIVGKWREVGGTETMEIFKGGKVAIADEGLQLEGKFRIVNGESIELRLSGLGELAGEIVMRGTLSDSGLTFTTPDESIHTYRKLK